mmetsp:Transcript_48144/g.111511  ORF Transcript_48144/g.111511 Transcript_48144/m.111511 type:complete len:370 (-) Transcript_48144:597-1706(-)
MSSAMHSQTSVPNAKTSTFSVYFCIRSSSGAMYCGVPAYCIAPVMSSDFIRAKPKSHTFTSRCGESSTLCAFTSRCTTFLACMKERANATDLSMLIKSCIGTGTARPGAMQKRCLACRSWWREPPVTTSMMMENTGGLRCTARRDRMFGCRSFPSFSTSLSNSARFSALLLGSKSFLIATGVPCHVPLYMTLKPPLLLRMSPSCSSESSTCGIEVLPVDIELSCMRSRTFWMSRSSRFTLRCSSCSCCFNFSVLSSSSSARSRDGNVLARFALGKPPAPERLEASCAFSSCISACNCSTLASAKTCSLVIPVTAFLLPSVLLRLPPLWLVGLSSSLSESSASVPTASVSTFVPPVTGRGRGTAGPSSSA